MSRLLYKINLPIAMTSMCFLVARKMYDIQTLVIYYYWRGAGAPINIISSRTHARGASVPPSKSKWHNHLVYKYLSIFAR